MNTVGAKNLGLRIQITLMRIRIQFLTLMWNQIKLFNFVRFRIRI
jgi:hypothetical protein